MGAVLGFRVEVGLGSLRRTLHGAVTGQFSCWKRCSAQRVRVGKGQAIRRKTALVVAFSAGIRMSSGLDLREDVGAGCMGIAEWEVQS